MLSDDAVISVLLGLYFRGKFIFSDGFFLSFFPQTVWWMVKLFIDYGDVIFSKAEPDKQLIS